MSTTTKEINMEDLESRMHFAKSVAAMMQDKTPAFKAGEPYLDNYDEYLGHLRDWKVNFAQDPKEFRSFLADVCGLYGGGAPDGGQQPLTVVEIGTRAGGSMYMLGAHLPTYSTFISIDQENGPWGSPASGVSKRKIAERLEGGMGLNVHLIEEDSHNPTTFYHLLKLLSGRKADVLLVDGDHTYEGVKMDWLMYSPLVRPGGIVAFHDITPMSVQRGPLEVGVPQLWNEIKGDYKHAEYIAQPNRKFGIGVLWMP
jgi:hypothetical protein